MSDFTVVSDMNPLYAELDRLKRERDALADALRLAREELGGLPHSLGYAFTHLPKIDAALAQVRK